MPVSSPSVGAFYAKSFVLRLDAAVRTWLHKDRRYQIGRFDVRLPGGHRLPWFQSLFPEYDRYAQELLRTFCAGAGSATLIDIGANVGDTSLLAIDAVPFLKVVAVEGNPYFVNYLVLNAMQAQDNFIIIDKFLRPADDLVGQYVGGPSTGGFGRATTVARAADTVTAEELLEYGATADLVIWKSDTDGLDIEILSANWEAISARCAIIWFEFDPSLNLGPQGNIVNLARRISESGRVTMIFDSIGRHMLTVDPTHVTRVLTDLTEWLRNPRIPGEVGYFDLWLIDETHFGAVNMRASTLLPPSSGGGEPTAEHPFGGAGVE